MPTTNYNGWTAIQVNSALLMSISAKKSIDITRIVGQIEIFKSIFHPTTSGNIGLSDASGLIQSLPVLGEELLYLELQTPNRGVYTGVYYVYRVEDQNYVENGANINYRLFFASTDQYNAITNIVAQGYKQNISDIVKGILTSNVSTKKQIEVEPTMGVENVIVPHWNCWQSIEWLRQRAVSATYKSPYVFFEDTDGYHFVSIEYLINKNKGQANSYVYTAESYLPGAGEGVGQIVPAANQYFNAFDLKITSKTNSAELIAAGGLSNQTLVFDFLGKTTNTVKAQYNDAASIIKQPLGDTFHPNHTDAFANTATPPRQYMIPWDSTNPSMHANNYSYRKMYSSMINETMISFNTAGDTQLDAGMIIQFNVPGRIANTSYDAQLTGQYIIGSLRHGVFSGQMVTSVDAYRMGFPKKII